MGCHFNSFNGEELESGDRFGYLGVKLSEDGKGKAEAESSVLQGRKFGNEMTALMNGKHSSVKCTRSLLEGVLVPTPMFGRGS